VKRRPTNTEAKPGALARFKEAVLQGIWKVLGRGDRQALTRGERRNLRHTVERMKELAARRLGEYAECPRCNSELPPFAAACPNDGTPRESARMVKREEGPRRREFWQDGRRVAVVTLKPGAEVEEEDAEGKGDES